MVSLALKCHATPLPLNVAQHAAAPTETGSHDASSWKLSIRSEACSQSGVSHDRKMISDFIFRSKSVPLSFLKCPIETSSSLSACHCVSVDLLHFLGLFFIGCWSSFTRRSWPRVSITLSAKRTRSGLRLPIWRCSSTRPRWDYWHLEEALVMLVQMKSSPTHFTQVCRQLFRAA